MKNKKRGKDFTEGPILKAVIALSIPIILGNLLQTLYNLTDTFWVGRLGAEAVAAVSLSFPVIFFIIALSGGIGMAGAVYVSQFKGKKDEKNLNHYTAQTFLMAWVAAIVFSIIGWFLTPWIVKILGAESGVVPGAVSYMQISFLGLLFVFGYMVFQSVVRGAGDAKTPAYIVLGTVILNLILDPLFIFGFGIIPAMGVSGAALATLFTQGLALLVGLILVFRGHSGIKLGLRCFKPDYGKMAKIVKLGIPVSLEQTSRSVGFLVMTAIAAAFGTTILAAFGIGMRIISLVIIPALSLAIANSTLVGQNMGAGKVRRAEKSVFLSSSIGFILLTVIGAIIFIFATPITRIFIPNDLEVVRHGALFLKIVAFSFGFIGVQMALIGALRGAGRTGQAMSIAMVAMISQIIIAYYVSFRTGYEEIGLWVAFPLSTIIGLIFGLFVYLNGSWKKTDLVGKK